MCIAAYPGSEDIQRFRLGRQRTNDPAQLVNQALSHRQISAAQSLEHAVAHDLIPPGHE